LRKNVEECDGKAEDGSSCSATCLACAGADDFLAGASSASDAGPSDYGRCYRFEAGPAPFAEASQSCSAVGASLVTYPNYYDPELVYGGLLRSHPGATYLGIFRDKGMLLWLTGGGEPRRPFWAAGEPGSSPNDCVVQGPAATSSSGYPLSWTTVTCATPRAYVCQRQSPFVRPRDNHAYRVLYERATWDRAKTGCEKLGGHLATIGDADEQMFVTSQGLGTDVWIGANDLQMQGTFEWITKETFGYAKLAPWDGFSASNRCLLLHRDSYWYTRRCSDANAYLCELE
jgi:hypothetical protein